MDLESCPQKKYGPIEKVFDLVTTDPPAMYEKGGGYSNTGYSVIITDNYGDRKTAEEVYTKGPLACREHALIPVEVNDYIIETNYIHGLFTQNIYRIKEINKEKGELIAIKIPIPSSYLKKALEVGREKAVCYHCKEPHYISK